MAQIAAPLELPRGLFVSDTPSGWLESFRRLEPSSPWGVPGHAFFEPSATAPHHAGHLVFSFAVHGNEWGTLPAAVWLTSGLASGHIAHRGPVSVLIGNLAAIEQQVRFVEEDYNRVFGFDRPAESLERKRAERVRPVLDAADFFFDMHQTQTPTKSAFWTFPWSDELAAWARVIGAAPRGLVRAPGGSFSPGLKCLDEYVRDRGRVGITVELGEKGPDSVQAQAAFDAACRLIGAYDAVQLAQSSLLELRDGSAPVLWYETVDVVAPPSPTAKLRPGLCCFSEVRAGQLLSAADSPPLYARQDGYVMFPKYPAEGQPPPPEIYRLAAPISEPERLDSTAR